MNINDTVNAAGGVYVPNTPKGAGTPVGFGSALNEAVNKKQSARVLPAQMSLNEYKRYISDRISRLPMSRSTVLDSIIVKITDTGFLNMQQQPDFEEWVIGTLKGIFAANDIYGIACGGKMQLISFGTKMGQVNARSWYKGEPGAKNESGEFDREEGFWERRRRVTRENTARNIKRSSQEHKAQLYALQRKMLQEGKTGVLKSVSAAEIFLDAELLKGEHIMK